MSIVDQNKEKQYFSIDQLQNGRKENVRSEFFQLYQEILKPVEIDHLKIQQKFRQNEISYNPNATYQQFHFDVEKIIPSYTFYRIHVKIGYFSLFLTLLRHKSNNLIDKTCKFKSTYGQVYFVTFGSQEICIKSIPYKSEYYFGKLISMTIKEISILKICSILKCAPYLQNYFGFDIVVYDDCIQYAMERGRSIHQVTYHHLQQLRAQLRLMHQLRIVHLDVKTQNVIWSNHYNKVVFIDFGFAEVIKEQFGFKTLCSYKGTPNFASPEMLELIMNGQGYIDLYYNDAYGVSLILKSMSQRQYFQCREDSQDIQIQEFQSKDDSFTSNFLLFSFQYYYITNNRNLSKFFMNKYLQIDHKRVKIIFSFIRQVLDDVFQSKLFYEDLSSFSEYIEYQQIKHRLKLHGQISFFKYYLHEYCAENFHEINKEINQVEPLEHLNDMNISTYTFQHYLKQILSVIILPKDLINHYIFLAFECVRFDIKNLDCEEKNLIIVKINQLLSSSQLYYNKVIPFDAQKDASNNKLIKFQYFFTFVLRYCLNLQPNTWIKNHIFEIYEQLIMVDGKYYQYIDEFLQYVKQHFRSYEDRAIIVLNLSRLLQTLRVILNNQQQLTILVYTKLKDVMMREHKFLLQFTSEKASNQEISIKKLLNIIASIKGSDENFHLENNLQMLMHVKNFKIRKYLLYFLVVQQIQYALDFRIAEGLLNLTQFIKTSLELRSLDLMSYMRINLMLTNGTFNHKEQHAFCSHIASIINCPQIYNKIIIVNFSLKRTFDSKSIRESMMQIKNTFNNYNQYRLVQAKFAELLYYTIKQKIKFDTAEDKQLLYELYHTYFKHNLRKDIQDQCQRGTHYHLIYIKIQIEYFFYAFSQNTKDLFLQNFKFAVLHFERLKVLNIEQNSYELSFIIYQVLLYEYYILVSKKEWESCLKILNDLEKFLRNLPLNDFILEALKQMNVVSILSEKEELIIDNVFKLYNFCKKQKYFSFYLQPQNTKYFRNTFVVFARYSKPHFFQLIDSLTKFLLQHPVNQYINRLILILDDFLKSDPTYGYIIHYRNFPNYFLMNIKQNPYILIFFSYSLFNENETSRTQLLKLIAMNCELLNEFARRTLLQKYYSVYLHFLQKDDFNRRLFIFRNVKRYLSNEKIRQQSKILFKFSRISKNNNNEIKSMIKSKIKAITNLYNLRQLQ